MVFAFPLKLYDNIYIKKYVQKMIIIIIVTTIMTRGDTCMTLTLKDGSGRGGEGKGKIICYRM